jgi:cytoskeletal protein CcmA (bactofilin family)
MINKNIPGVLLVGNGVIVNGSIDAPDGVVNAGTIIGNISTEKMLIEISGVAEGFVNVNNLDVAGEIKNCEVNVDDLLVRSTGLVTGVINYGQMGIERGGQLSGTITSHAKNNNNAKNYEARNFDDLQAENEIKDGIDTDSI